LVSQKSIVKYKH